MDFKDLLRYEPDTGLMFWKVSRGFIKAGTPAGGKHQNYMRLTYAGKRYRLHHIAWSLMKGKPYENGVRHINGDMCDNRWANLRKGQRDGGFVLKCGQTTTRFNTALELITYVYDQHIRLSKT